MKYGPIQVRKYYFIPLTTVSRAAVKYSAAGNRILSSLHMDCPYHGAD